MSALLALDVGDKRIGIAITNSVARLPRPLVTLPNDANFSDAITQILDTEGVETLVIGMPRDIQGNETAQTRTTQAFISQLQATIDIPIVMQDEALTSQKAEQELEAAGKPYSKGDVDALAACYILQDYLIEHES